MLNSVLEQVSAAASPGDTLVFLGDYIDRGPDSLGVVERVLELRAGAWEGPVVTLMGNHEDMLLDHLRDTLGGPRLYDTGIWEYNGGCDMFRSYVGADQYESFILEFNPLSEENSVCSAFLKYGIQRLLPERHLAFFRDLALSYEDEHAHYLDAGFAPERSASEQQRYEKLWIRDSFLYSTCSWGKPVVFGHTPQRPDERHRRRFAPLNRPEKIGIDTGSCYGGYLTAVQLPERVFFRSAP